MSGHTYTHILTQNYGNYYNPRCAHAHRGLITLAARRGLIKLMIILCLKLLYKIINQYNNKENIINNYYI